MPNAIIKLTIEPIYPEYSVGLASMIALVEQVVNTPPQKPLINLPNIKLGMDKNCSPTHPTILIVLKINNALRLPPVIKWPLNMAPKARPHIPLELIIVL